MYPDNYNYIKDFIGAKIELNNGEYNFCPLQLEFDELVKKKEMIIIFTCNFQLNILKDSKYIICRWNF